MYETYNSVTRKEYETARDKDIPIFIFVDKNVKAELETYKANKENTTIKYAHVDSVNVFKLLDEILLQKRNNYVREFDKFEDITNWLREQWAGIFADLLARKRDDVTLRDMSARLSDLNQVTNSLREYTQSILMKVDPEESKPIIDREQNKQRSATVQRFSRAPLIRYILDESKEFDKDVNGLKIYQAMEKAANFDQFVRDFHPEIVDHLNKVPVAKKDFVELKNEYFNVDLSSTLDNETKAA